MINSLFTAFVLAVSLPGLIFVTILAAIFGAVSLSFSLLRMKSLSKWFHDFAVDIIDIGNKMLDFSGVEPIKPKVDKSVEKRNLYYVRFLCNDALEMYCCYVFANSFLDARKVAQERVKEALSDPTDFRDFLEGTEAVHVSFVGDDIGETK